MLLIVCFGIVIPAIIRLIICYWMYKDAKKRGEKEVLWLIVGLVGGLIGLLIWLIVRPDMSEVKRKTDKFQKTAYSQKSSRYQRREPGKPCPDCDHPMRWIKEHDRWFCDNCDEYK